MSETAAPGAGKASEMALAPTASLSFEEALAELERIVRDLESGKQRLEDAIAAYERGAVLRRHCEAKLAEAEQRVAAIAAGAEGAVSLRPMN